MMIEKLCRASISIANRRSSLLFLQRRRITTPYSRVSSLFVRAEATAINPRDDDALFSTCNCHRRQYHSSSMKYSSKEEKEVESLSNNNSITVPELSVIEVAKALRLVVESNNDDDKGDDDDDSNNNNLSNYVYIDCRSEEEQATGIVPGSRNMPYPHNGDDEMIDPEEWLEDLVYELFDDPTVEDKDMPIFVGCKKGQRSLMACEVLIQAGYTNVTNVQGGMLAWYRADLPMAPFTG